MELSEQWKDADSDGLDAVLIMNKSGGMWKVVVEVAGHFGIFITYGRVPWRCDEFIYCRKAQPDYKTTWHALSVVHWHSSSSRRDSNRFCMVVEFHFDGKP
jgi:hypothetical protein